MIAGHHASPTSDWASVHTLAHGTKLACQSGGGASNRADESAGHGRGGWSLASNQTRFPPSSLHKPAGPWCWFFKLASKFGIPDAPNRRQGVLRVVVGCDDRGGNARVGNQYSIHAAPSVLTAGSCLTMAGR
ncbi:hypothetical protein SCUP234_00730 [Seiridium cupressi]